ncbi:hypothetical protein ACHAPT_002302 [Fusarium lateritium]
MSRQISIELEGAKDLEYHLTNEKDRTGRVVPHRKAVTGTDREGTARLMSVIGLMPTVVHGSAHGEPHTLVILEWNVTSGRQGLRFKEVTIEMSFAADGPRGDAEDEAEELRQQGGTLNFWDPEVVAVVPTGTGRYIHTRRKVGTKGTWELGFSAGFGSFVSLAPKYAVERDRTASITDCIQVIGQPFLSGSGRNRSNSIRWTMLENESQRSGVPNYLRTAVLLRREPYDNGIFLGHINVETHVSWWEDLMEKKRKLTGHIKTDEPVVFDPTDVVPSPFDDMKDNLDKVDLHAEFRIISLEPLAASGEEEKKDEEAGGVGEATEATLTGHV